MISDSLVGLFTETGPFRFDLNDYGLYYNDNDPNANNVSWAYNYNMLFINSLIGAGFSYTNDANYPNNEDQVQNSI